MYATPPATCMHTPQREFASAKVLLFSEIYKNMGRNLHISKSFCIFARNFIFFITKEIPNKNPKRHKPQIALSGNTDWKCRNRTEEQNAGNTNSRNRTSSVAAVSTRKRAAADARQFSAAERTVVYGLLLPQPAERHVADYGTDFLRRQDAF